jgi:hypothetical protein
MIHHFFHWSIAYAGNDSQGSVDYFDCAYGLEKLIENKTNDYSKIYSGGICCSLGFTDVGARNGAYYRPNRD